MSSIPNLLGVHALVWVGGWTKDQCREVIKNTAEAGYGLIINIWQKQQENTLRIRLLQLIKIKIIIFYA